MSIQSTPLVAVKTDYTGLKDSVSTSIERSLLEKIDSMQGSEKPSQPKFTEVLDNKNDLQPKTLPRFNTHTKSSKSDETRGVKSSKDNHSLPHNTLVKSKGKASESVKQSSGKALKDSQPLTTSNEGVKEEQYKDNCEENNLSQAISLSGSFMQDTLKEINLKQNLSWKNSDTTGSLPDQLNSNDLLEKLPSDMVQIEMLSPLKEGTFSLNDDQMKRVTDLLSLQTEIPEGSEVLLETLLTADSVVQSNKEPKSIVEMSLIEAINEGKNRLIKEEKVGVDTQHISSRDIQAELSPNNIDSIIPITDTQTNFGSMGSGFSGSFANNNNGLAGIGSASFRTSLEAKAGFNVEGSMAQTKLDQLNTLMQVKDHFKMMLNNKESHLKVILTPDELGTVEITLDILKDTVVSTLIKAERRETMELLSRHAEEIDMLFKNAGLQSDLTNMNFSSSQQEFVEQDNAAGKKYAEKSAEEVGGDPILVESEITDSDTFINIKA